MKTCFLSPPFFGTLKFELDLGQTFVLNKTLFSSHLCCNVVNCSSLISWSVWEAPFYHA